jgi:hypothetical protein
VARYNEIQVGRYNRSLQKLLSMKGPAALESLQPELMAVINTFYGVENRYLEGWDRFNLSINLAATVGQTDSFRFRNTAGSNVVAVFEKITLQGGGLPALLITRGAPTGDLGTILANSASRFDARGRGSWNLIISDSVASPADLGSNVWQAFPASTAIVDVILDDDQEIPLLPGDAIQISNTTQNASLTMTAWWRERFLEDSERA